MTIFKKFESDIIDLSYLLEASDNDSDFMLMMIKSFLKNNSAYLDELKVLYKIEDYSNLYSSVHKYRGSVVIIGIPTLSNLLIEVEQKSLAKQCCSDKLIKEIEEIGNKAANELEFFIASEKIE